ncbi:MAG: hypothetical protein ABEN55_15805 [Bradymonadaceae bacterium]
MRTFFHILVATAALAVVLGASPPASAQTIDVEVRAISASKQGDSFDKKLSDLKSKLEKVFANYSHFEQLSQTSIQLDKGQTDSVNLPEGSTLEITFHGLAKDLIKLGVDVGDKMSTTLRASPGSTFFQAGLEYDDGILILAITVDQ